MENYKLGSLVFAIFCFLNTTTYGQIQIGGGNEDEELPIDPYYGYSYSQVIYLASEIALSSGDTITHLKWYFDGSSLSSSNNWTIYIGHTSKTSFSSTSDWISVSSLTQVYSNTFTSPTASGWLTFDITDWIYNGTDNIVVAVDENANGYDGSSDIFFSSAVTANRSLEYHADATNPDPSSPPSGTLKQYIANIIFIGLEHAPQSSPFSEDWESGIIKSYWDLYCGANGIVQVNTSSKNNGSYGLELYGDGGSFSTPSSLADAYTKAQSGGANENKTSYAEISIDLSGTTSPKLTFYYSLAYKYDNSYNNFWTQIDTGSGWVDLFSTQTNGSTISYTKKEIDISSYIDDTVNVRFFHNGKYDDNYLYIDDITIGEISCPNPTDLSISSITDSSAILSWVENGTATTWEVEYDTSGYTQGAGTSITGITSKPYTLDSLSANTAYDWYVRADCGGSNSDWMGPYTFSTTINTFPWTEGFENGGNIPAGWTQEYENGSHDWVFQTGGHNNEHPSNAYEGSYNAAFTYKSSRTKTKLITPQLDISTLSNPQLSFWHTQEDYSGDQDTLRVYYKTSASGGWNLISGAEFTSSISSWTQETFSLPSASATYYIAFEGVDDYGYGVCVDQVRIEGASCAVPSNLTVTSIDTSSAQLDWTENGSATTWEIEYGIYGFTQGNGTTISGISSKPYTLSGLNSGTQYAWYIRADCGSSNYSSWSSENSFTTSCTIESLPWNEGFENLNVVGNGELPACMHADNTNYWYSSDGTQSYNRKAHTDSNYIYVEYCADDWLFTPGFKLEAGKFYEFSFYYIADGGDGWDEVSAYIGNSQTISAMTTQIGTSITYITNTSYQQKTITFMVATTGTYYIGIYVYGDCADEEYLSFDDLELKEGCNTNKPPLSENFSLYEPDCWQEKQGQLSPGTSFTNHISSAWDEDDFANDSENGSESARINISGTSLADWLISPSVDLSGGNYQLEYDIALTGYDETSDSTLSSDDSLAVIISTDDGTTWSNANILKLYGASSELSGETFHEIINLSSYSSTVKIGFYAKSSVSNSNVDLFIDNFEIDAIPGCQQVFNQSSDNIDTVSATLEWSEFGSSSTWYIEYKAGSDFTPGTSAQDGIDTASTTPSHTLSGLTPATKYYWYIRPNCGGTPGNWLGPDSFWTEAHSAITYGKICTCSPVMTESNELRFYDQFSFTVAQSGTYDINGYFYEMNGQLRVYRNSFDPESTSTNKIASQNAYTLSQSRDSEGNIEGISLSAGTTYIFVGTSYMFDYAEPDLGNFKITISGQYLVTADDTTEYYGIPPGAAYELPSTSGTTRTADYECTDSEGWTHYYDDNGTSEGDGSHIGHKDDKLLLSVKKNNNDIGTVDNGVNVKLAGSLGVSLISKTSTNYVNKTNGWYVYNRYWELSPLTQPSTDVGIRYYYTDADFTALTTTITNSGGSAPSTHTNTSYYKINGSYTINPASGHSSVPVASTYSDDGCWIYTNGTQSGTNTWKYGTYDDGHYAEYFIASFSGGGGGASTDDGSGNGSPLDYGFWTGDISTDWNTGSNWSINQVPTASDNIKVPDTDNDPVISTAANCNNLSLENNAVLTINPEYSLTCSGEITNNSGNSALVLKSNSQGTASLLHNTSNIAATVERYTSGQSGGTNHFVSSPVQNTDISTLQDASNGNYHIYTYNSSQSWQQVSSGSMNTAQGYVCAYDTNKTIEFTGNLNNGDQNVSISSNDGDWALVGNPFPSAISTLDFINTTNNPNIYGTVYFWDQSTNYNANDYASRNGSGTANASIGGSSTIPDENIAVGQAFFVECNGSGSTVYFDQDWRTASNPQFFVHATDYIERMKLKIIDPGLQENEILIAFLEGATNGFDPMYDGHKLRGNPDLAFYSKLLEDDGKNYIIQGLPLPDEHKIEIKLGYFSKTKGLHSIQLSDLENWTNTNKIILEDKYLGNCIDLKESDTYSFASDSGEITNRFILKLNDMSTDHILQQDENNEIITYLDGKTIYLQLKYPVKGILEIVNMNGQKIFERNINQETLLSVSPDLSTGLYLLIFKSNDIMESRKMLIN